MHKHQQDLSRAVNEFRADMYSQMYEISISAHHYCPDVANIILLRDFNAHVGREKKHRRIVGLYPAYERTNTNGEKPIKMCETFSLELKSTVFNYLPSKAKTWKSPNPNLGEMQIDHLAVSSMTSK